MKLQLGEAWLTPMVRPTDLLAEECQEMLQLNAIHEIPARGGQLGYFIAVGLYFLAMSSP